mgnify:CR=1 FL=1
MNPVLPALFGSQSAAQVLLFLQNYGEGHARRIATTFDVPHMAIQRQLRRLEDAGVLVSRKVGNLREFVWNPRRAGSRSILWKFLAVSDSRFPSVPAVAP